MDPLFAIKKRCKQYYYIQQIKLLKIAWSKKECCELVVFYTLKCTSWHVKNDWTGWCPTSMSSYRCAIIYVLKKKSCSVYYLYFLLQ